MMYGWQRYDIDEDGIQISVHKCWACGCEFTLCPAVAPDTKGWDDCLQPICASYDPDRDIDAFFDEGDCLSIEGAIRIGIGNDTQ